MKATAGNKWGTRWITSKARPIKSKIDSRGVEAIKPIKKGETVAVLGGLIVPKNQIKEYWKKMGIVGIQMSDGFYIVPPNHQELEKYGVYNHSCDPNIGFHESIVVYAIRNIKKGEELVIDYAMTETDKPSFKCNCGSKNCRKVIRPTDWKLKDVQKRLGKYFSPFLRTRIGL